MAYKKMIRWMLAACALGIGSLAVASPPTAPSGLAATAASSTQISLTWTASTDSGATITAYVIQRCQGAGCSNFAQVGSVATGTTYTDSGLVASTAYQYQVYATDSASTSSPVSNTASATTLVTSVSSSVTYGYDALGRLVQANVAALNLVENYTYDSAGNLLSITPSATSTLAVANLSSPQGQPGSTVTIFGSGFSTTPASNTVEFNGKVATVVSATSTQLVVTVPTSATTGAITVQTGTTTVSSPGTFTVKTKTGAPTITSFTPPVAITGGTVTLTGSGFQTVLADNQVQVNQTAATVVAATSTSLSFVVPSFDANLQSSGTFSAMSAPITVATPTGSVTSATDLIISGAPIAAPIFTTVGAAPVTFSTANAGVAQLLTFNATAGQPLELVANTQTTPGTIVGTVIAPNGTTAARLNFTASGQSLQIATPVSGRYTVYFYPYGTQGGSVSFSIIGPVTGALTLNGSPVTETLTVPGQTAVLTFSGTQGQNVVLSFSGVTLSSAATLVLQTPNGSALLTQPLSTTGLTLSPTLPANGTYTILVTPPAAATGAFTAALTSAGATTLTPNQVRSLTLAGTAPTTLTFDSTAGQILSLAAAETTGASSTLTLTILQPDGTALASTYAGLCTTCGTTLYYNAGPLTQTGTYSLVASQSSTASNTFALSLSTPVIGTATVGTPANVTLAFAGQAASESFAGNAGQYVSASLVLSSTSVGSTGTLAILGPDGTTIASGITSTCGGSCNPQGVVSAGPLPATGTYTFLYEQDKGEPTGSGALTITVLAPVTGTLAVGSANPVVVSGGQGFAEIFAASAGQSLSVTLQASGAGAPTNGTASVLDPNGALIASTTFSGHNGLPTTLGSAILNLGPLAIGGNYTVLLQQATSSAGLGAGTVTVTPELTASGTLTAGSPSNVSVASGQGFMETFTGTAGQYFSVALQSAQGASAPTAGTIEILSSTGTVLAMAAYGGTYCSTSCDGAGNINVGPLPANGQYTLVFQQNNSLYSPPGAGNITVTPEAAIRGTLTFGTPTNLTLAAGQGVQESFSGTAGQYATVSVTESASLLQGATITVLGPSGATVAKGAFTATCSTTCSGTSSLNIGPLASAGTYTVLLQQTAQAYGFGTGSLALTVANNTPDTGTSQNLSTSTAGQSAQFSFGAAALQSFELAFSNMVLTPSTVTSYTVKIYDPTGVNVNNGNCTSGTTCLIALTSASSGTYTATITPGGSATMSFTASAGPLVTGILNAGTPFHLSLSSPGENALLSFAATAGQDFAVEVSGMTSTPASTTYTVWVYDPTNNLVAASYPTSAANLNVPIALTGTYTVSISTTTPSTASMQLTLVSGATEPVAATGTGVNINTTLLGQNAYYTFSGTFAQSYTLALGNVVETPSGLGSASVTVTSPSTPNGQETWTANCTSSCVDHLPPLPVTGTYIATILPNAQATMSATAYLTPDVTGALTAGTPLNLTLSETGQSASLTFEVTGEAAQAFGLAVTNLSALPSGTAYTVTVSNFNQRDVQVISGPVTANSQFNLPNLAPGTYVVTLVPTAPATATMQVTLSAAVTGTFVAGTTQNLTLAKMGQGAWLTFNVTAGQIFALYTGAITASPASTSYTTTVYNFAGTNVASASSATSTTLNLANLAVGTYKVFIAPQTPATATLQATLEKQTGGTLATSGTTTAYTTPAPGQNAYFTFAGTAGQDLGIGLTGLTLTPSSQQPYAVVYIYEPNGTTLLTYGYCNTGSPGGGCQFSLTNLPVTGNYSMVVYPGTQQTMSFNMTASKDVSGTLALNTAKSVTLVPGQNTWLTFTATAGETVAVSATSIVTTPAAQSVALTVYNSSGTSVGTASGTGNATVNLANLAAGTYSVLAVPAYGASATMQVTVAAGIAPTLTLNGTTTNYTTTEPGQYAYFYFSGTAGQDLGLALTGLTLTPSSQQTYAVVYVYEPNGTTLLTYNFYYTTTPGVQFSLTNLPVTGTYSVQVIPGTQQTMSFNLTASQDVSGTLALNTAKNVTLVPGQNTWLTFTATAGEAVAVSATSIVTNPAGQSVALTVYNASGTSVGNASGTSSATVNLTNLAAGTYSVLAVPAYGASATMQVTVAAGVAPTLPLNGTTTNYATTEPGQDAYFYFSGTAGQDLGIALTALTLTPSSQQTYAFVYVYEPNGTTALTYNYCYTSNPGGGCQFSLTNLPVTGTYTVQVIPGTLQTMSFNFTASQDVSGTLALNTAKNVTLVPGQDTWLTFTTTAGETVAVSATSIVTTPAGQSVALTVYNSSGTSVGNVTGTSSATVNLTNLAAGTYSVLAVPSYGASATMQVTVAAGVAPTLPLNGTTTNYTTAEPGQDAYFYFSGTAGQNLAIALTGLTLTPSSQQTYAFVYVYEPNGTTVLTYNYFYTSNPGLQFSLTNLPVTGTYRVQVIPGTLQTMSFNLTASQDVSATLALNTAQNVTLADVGQNAWLTFSISSAQTVTVTTSGISATPANTSYGVTVYNSGGSSVGSTSTTTGNTLTLTSLAAGTYNILISPQSPATASLQVTYQ